MAYTPVIPSTALPHPITITSNGQTAFVLPSTPSVPGSVWIEVNGQIQTTPGDFTLSGLNLSWLNNGFKLATTDKLVAFYE